MKILSSTLAILLLSTTASVSHAYWQDIQARSNNAPTPPLQQFRQLQLDEVQLSQALTAATQAPVDQQARGNIVSISIPLPQGGFAQLTASPSQVLAPELAERYPDIRTWKVTGTDGKVINGVIDMTSSGFHAMLTLANGDTLFIDPQTQAGQRTYLSFTQQANRIAFQQQGWSCQTDAASQSFANSITNNFAQQPQLRMPQIAARAGETLHTYRLAMAATGEYTQFHGGQTSAYNAIITAVNRINQVFERDLSLRLQLVSDTNLVFANPNTDPYVSQVPTFLIERNQQVIDQQIGSSSYDIGHVLTTSSGGLASVSAVCGQGKAEGMSGLSSPQGDSFVIDYLTHEIGHQMGATHTFNGQRGACAENNREASTAYEPGSGSTIMGYTGLCNGDDLQKDSDSMFHSASIQQITAFMHNGNGANCASRTTLGNTLPVANAGQDYTIPAGTPFILTGNGQDQDGNTLSYSWEQLDSGTASYVNVDLGNNALLRTFAPNSSPIRTVPRIQDLISNTKLNGEFLPVTTRTLNFRLLVRDGKGGVSHDDMQVKVHNTGSNFTITSPTNRTLSPGAPLSVTWNVANTDQPPINCQQVDIAFSKDNGQTFTNLQEKVPNTGGSTVILPSDSSTRGHIRVKCSDNIFFALSATSPARAALDNNSSTGGSSGSSSDNSGSGISLGSSGGGSMPLSWLLLGGAYIFWQRRQGGKA